MPQWAGASSWDPASALVGAPKGMCKLHGTEAVLIEARVLKLYAGRRSGCWLRFWRRLGLWRCGTQHGQCSCSCACIYR